jgi:hypothetical protein
MIREVLAFTVGAALATGFFCAMEADYRHELEIAQMKLVQEKLRRETLITDTHKFYQHKLKFERQHFAPLCIETRTMTAREMLWHLDELFNTNPNVQVDYGD